MQTYKNLYEQVYQFDRLHQAYLKARRGKRDRREVLRFEQNLEGELIQLQNELIWGQYQTGPYRTFDVTEPKRRLVAALPFRDRVLQHSLVSVIEPIWESRFHHHSYACRPGRGMHAGADQAQQWLREVQRTHGRAYCLKADVRKYFPSINHDILMQILGRRIACRRTLDLCRAIISTWGPGLPIGNLTSQLFANVYLHQLDDYVKQELREHRYMRYMDDWLIIHHDKQHLHRIRQDIEWWLHRELGLHLNSKTQVFPVTRQQGRGLDFLGYRAWTTHRRLRRDSVKRMQRRMRVMQRDYRAGLIGIPEINARIASWVGHAQHADSYRIRGKLLGGPKFTKPRRAVFKRLNKNTKA